MKASWTPGPLFCGVDLSGAFVASEAFPEADAHSLLEGLRRPRVPLPDPLDGDGTFAVVRMSGGGVSAWLWGLTAFVVGVSGSARLVRGEAPRRWTAVDLAHVDGVILGDPAPPKADALPVEEAIFQAGSLRLGTAARSGHVLTRTPPARLSAAGASSTEPEDPVASFDVAALWGHTVARPVEAAAIRKAAADGDQAASRTAPEASHPHAPGQGVAGPDARSASAHAGTGRAEGPVGAGLDVHDGRTLIAPPAPVPEEARPGAWIVRSSVGDGVPLLDAVLIGRSPSADVTCRSGVLIVPAGHSDVSRTHARIDHAAGRVTVTDLGSNNGTLLRGRDGRAVPLRPHIATPLGPGERVELGAGVTLFVEAVGGTP